MLLSGCTHTTSICTTSAGAQVGCCTEAASTTYGRRCLSHPPDIVQCHLLHLVHRSAATQAHGVSSMIQIPRHRHIWHPRHNRCATRMSNVGSMTDAMQMLSCGALSPNSDLLMHKTQTELRPPIGKFRDKQLQVKLPRKRLALGATAQRSFAINGTCAAEWNNHQMAELHC
jgi:hypothetical protein